MPAAKTTTKTPVRMLDPIVDVVELDAGYDGEGDDTTSPEPEVPVVERCLFPREMKGGRCPTAVFNAPTSPNESISFPRDGFRDPLKFDKGLLAVFTEEDADIVRQANPGGRVYLEANPKLGDDPLVCSACYPKTRWYSALAYERHMRFKHSDV